MAKSNSTTETTEDWEWLSDLLPRSLWPLDGFVNSLEDLEAHYDLFKTLIPLLDCVKTNLEIIGEVLAQSFGGDIKVETTPYLRVFGAFHRDNFKRAFVVPARKSQAGA